MTTKPQTPAAATTAHIRFAFFGSSEFSVIVLDELASNSFLPTLIVTAPDNARGRGLKLVPTPVKIWAEEHGVPVITPARLRGDHTDALAAEKVLTALDADVFLTASYGKIIPENILAIPRHGNLNVHPSLLPKFRGPTPIESAILSPDTAATGTGVTIMVVDKEIDHGAIVAQEKLPIDTVWPPYAEELEDTLAHMGGALLSKTLPNWIAGTVKAVEQNHADATFTKKITSADGLVNLADDPRANLRKIRAFHAAPGAYFFAKKEDVSPIRIRITRARIENDTLVLERVVPEGKKEMAYEDFLRGFRGTI